MIPMDSIKKFLMSDDHYRLRMHSNELHWMKSPTKNFHELGWFEGANDRR